MSNFILFCIIIFPLFGSVWASVFCNSKCTLIKTLPAVLLLVNVFFTFYLILDQNYPQCIINIQHFVAQCLFDENFDETLVDYTLGVPPNFPLFETMELAVVQTLILESWGFAEPLTLQEILEQIEYEIWINKTFSEDYFWHYTQIGNWVFYYSELFESLTIDCLNLLYFGINWVIYLGEISFLFLKTSVEQTEWIWISSGLFEVKWEFFADNLTLIMLLVVNSVSFLVHIYSLEYMATDPHKNRFMAYLSLFTFFMLILITGDNFVILFLGWEGVGLCSYLLIGFWYTRIQANKSAIKALVVNRISDFGLTIGLLFIYYIFRSLDFAVVFAVAPLFYGKTFLFCGYNLDILSVISGLLFFGACGKSAQIGLHTWLPDAMEGPTPVSALIHAATMVTAGVFLIIKCSPLFEYAPVILTLVTFVGALTALFAATAGLVQNDIKKVIAYSTCSQLGYMIFACGISSYHASFFHLVNHAFFKALLFLSAGAIIHSLANEQDMRKYGGLLNLLPFTSVMLLIGSLSLMGLPFLTGFYSKDLILELAFGKYTISGAFAYWLGLMTAFFTSFYSYRMFYLTFINKTNSYRKVVEHIHELPKKMAVSLGILALGSIFLGYLLKDLFVGLGTDFWNDSIFILPVNNNQVEAEFIPHLYKLLPVFSSMIAITLCNVLFELNFPWTILRRYDLKRLYRFLINKWYFDAIYNKLINTKILRFAYNMIFKLIDKEFLELVGPNGIVQILWKTSKRLRLMQTGEIYRYAGFFFYCLLIMTILWTFFF